MCFPTRLRLSMQISYGSEVSVSNLNLYDGAKPSLPHSEDSESSPQLALEKCRRRLRLRMPGEEEIMAYTIAEPCIDVKDTACVDVCRSIVSIPRRMRQRRFSRFISSISTLRSALIAGPASLFAPLRLFSRTTRCRKNGSITPILTQTITRERIELLV
jgi:hypothetical protein